MAELLVQNTSLTSIADAIREKAGLTDSFVFPEGFVEAIAGIEAGGDILGHKFAAGSFTLTEDTTTTYTVLNNSELFEAIKADFPGATGLTDNIYSLYEGATSAMILTTFLAAICWIEPVGTSGVPYKSKQFLAGFLPKSNLSSSLCSTAYTDSYRNFTAKSYASLEIDSRSGFTIAFSTSYNGYAGSKYNWLVFPLEHGEVA